MSPSTKPAIYNMVIVSLMAAVLCLMGPWSLTISLSPVPLSFCTLAIYFIVFVLNARHSAISVLIYLLIGLMGLPVFSGFQGGIGRLFGPTGGYLISYVLMAFICGFFVNKWPCQRTGNRIICFIGFLLGTVVCYLIGSLWLAYQMNLTIYQAFLTGVIPYIPFDLLKIFLAMLAGPQIRKTLQKNGLISN